MNKVYSRIIWKNYPNTSTALNETNLNRMDKAIDDLDNRVIEQDSTKANQTTVNNMVKNWTMDETTGVITVEKQDGSKIMFDLNIEKIPVTFELSPSGILTMTTSDGTQFTANIGSMIPVLTFNESDQIAVSVSGSGVNKTYSFSIKDNSITENKLQPNFLADIKVQSANASLSANNAETSATQAQSYAIGGTGTRENEDTDNAMYYYEQAKQTDIGQISSKVDEINSKLSKQLGSHTVKSDVPENAVFTDTVYNDTEVKERLSNTEKCIATNILNPSLKTTTQNGITCTSDGKGTYTLTGTATADTEFYLLEDEFLSLEDDVKLVGCPSGGSDQTYKLKLQGASDSLISLIDAGEGVKIPKEITILNLTIYVSKGTTCNNVIFRPMLTSNLGATYPTSYDDFILYTGENVKLSSMVIDIKKYLDTQVKDDLDKLKNETKVNLFNKTLKTITTNGVTCTNNEDGTYTLNGTSTAYTYFTFQGSSDIDVKRGCKLLGCPTTGDLNKYLLMYNATIDGNSTQKFDDGDGSVMNEDGTITNVSINVSSGITLDNVIFKPMITYYEDATYDDFVPYTGDKGSLNGDVADIRKDIKTLENYKTTETVIGKWDDYTLCRKVISGKHAITAGNEFSFLVDTITSDEGVVMEIKNIRGRAQGSIISGSNKDVDGVMAVGSYCNANYYCGCFMPGSSPESISLLGKFGNSVNYVEVELCVEYTVERI